MAMAGSVLFRHTLFLTGSKDFGPTHLGVPWGGGLLWECRLDYFSMGSWYSMNVQIHSNVCVLDRILVSDAEVYDSHFKAHSFVEHV